jgi:predicted dehydrogenase/threonine dehydrogenase-like Zn-dependent dehydrogenase
VKQVLVRRGEAVVERVPAPAAEPGTVLVRVDHSCISIGTEMSGVRSSGRPLWKRAMEQPQQVKRVLGMVADQGVRATADAVRGKLDAGVATGYSAAGVVVESAGIGDLPPGTRVAVAGAQYAHHAEVVRVPRNLVVPVPDGVSLADASTVTLGAIALQGVRRASPTLGETFVVIGLGILGQLTAQLLAANGCRVIGTDLDRGRIRTALGLGMHLGVHPDDGAEPDQVARLTDGVGADGVIITAATPSDAVMSTAFRMCRRKGRVVLVGDVGLSLDREDFYRKELDFFISTSYGPGRYDERYEEHGVDYPVGYVRWTENRNMGEYLRLIADGRVRVAPLVAATYPVDRAGEAYAGLAGAEKPLMVLLSYPAPAAGEDPLARRVPNPRASASSGAGRVRLAVVGAGGFARGMHLPNLKALEDLYHLRAVASRTGHNAAATAAQFGAEYSATEYAEVLADPQVDAVLLATRHDLHAPMLLQALRAGKHVLAEKPLALTRDEVEQVRAFYAAAPAEGAPVLLTGFNRRFSPFAARAAELLAGRSGPLLMQYRMNAGYIPLDHWVHGPQGGGRNRGEACHIYDLFTFLAGARVSSVQAASVRPATGYYSASDNFVATVSFADGSVGTLVYTAMGAPELPKERMEVFADGKVLVLDDYLRLAVHGARAKGVELKTQDKGQKEELRAFARAVLNGGPWPIPLWQQIQATEIALDVELILKATDGE